MSKNVQISKIDHCNDLLNVKFPHSKAVSILQMSHDYTDIVWYFKRYNKNIHMRLIKIRI